MLMGNKHSNRASSAAPPTMKVTTSSPRISRNGSQRSGGGSGSGSGGAGGPSSSSLMPPSSSSHHHHQQHHHRPALAEAAVAAAAAAVTATAATVGSSGVGGVAGGDLMGATSFQLQQQHLADVLESCQPIQLSAYQKNLLREAWQKINKKGTGSIGTLIFRRMFSKNPEIKKVFQHVSVIEGVFGLGATPMQAFHHHSVLFVQILDTAIEQLDDLRPFVKKCVEYGAKHAPYRNYGFKADMWDIFGECMTEAAREWEGWKKHRETIRAWTILVSFIVDRMRQGYETAVRRQCFMQQLSTTKHSSVGSIVEPSENDSDDHTGDTTSGISLNVGGGGSGGGGSTTPDNRRFESSPRRRLASKVGNTSQESAAIAAAAAASFYDDHQQQQFENDEAMRISRAESH